MTPQLTDDELEERRCGLKKEKFCCEKEVQGGNLSHLLFSTHHLLCIIQFQADLNSPHLKKRDAQLGFSAGRLVLNHFHQSREQMFQPCSYGMNSYFSSNL